VDAPTAVAHGLDGSGLANVDQAGSS
jgi:hypothetical protein